MLSALLLAATLVTEHPSISEPFKAPSVVIVVPPGIPVARARAVYRRAYINCVFYAYLQDRELTPNWRERRKEGYLSCLKDEFDGTGITVSEDTSPSE